MQFGGHSLRVSIKESRIGNWVQQEVAVMSERDFGTAFGFILKIDLAGEVHRDRSACPKVHSLCHCDSRRIKFQARFGMVVAKTAVEVANHEFNDCCRPRTIQSADKTGSGHPFEGAHER